MATKQAKTPPTVHPAFDVKDEKAVAAKTAPHTIEQPKPAPAKPPRMGIRGIEQRRVPYCFDAAGRKVVAAPHPDAGALW